MLNAPHINTTDWEEYQPYVTIINSNPLATNDISEGYLIGNMWINSSTDNIYVCANNTINAAVWTTYVITASIVPIINITHADLLNLKNTSDLIPGQMYLITDFKTKYNIKNI